MSLTTAYERGIMPGISDSLPSSGTTTPQRSRSFARSATIVLVGARGSGKRSLGFIGAMHLGRRLITEDYYFQEVTGMSRKAFLSRYGNAEFYKKNVEVLRRMLEENKSNCIIECGMGSLAREAQAVLREYTKWHPVIYIMRNFDRIRRLLGLSEAEAKRLEYGDSAHRTCSNFEYYNLHDPSCENNGSELSRDRASANYSFGLKDAKRDFSNFLDFVTGFAVEHAAFESPFPLSALPAESRPHTHALCLWFSDMLRGDVDFSELESGCGDVVELIVDTWTPNMLSVVGKQVALIRRKIGVPIILSVEDDFLQASSASSNGTKFSNLVSLHPQYVGPSVSSKEDIATALLHHGLRLGIEYVVVNLDYHNHRITELVQAAGGTKVIGHHFDRYRSSTGWKDTKLRGIYTRATSLGCNIVRIVQSAGSARDNEDVRTFSESIEALVPSHTSSLIAYNVGPVGYSSMITNSIFSPVTHPTIKARGYNGSNTLLTAQETMSSLFQRAIYDPLQFYVIGATVSFSLSPAMHNAAYRVCGLSHHYQIYETSSIEELLEVAHKPDFGGAALSQPFKGGVMPHLHALSHHARAIGAVNTVLPLRDFPDGTSQFLVKQAHRRNQAGKVHALYGDNTDWIGISTCLRRNISPRNAVQPSKTTGLVIGAGGMARASIYALIQLGCRQIFIYNRTLANAEKVANHFNSWAAPLSDRGPIVTVLRSRDQAWPAEYRQPTLICSCLPLLEVSSYPESHFQVPVQWLGSSTGGIVMEMAYNPSDSPLLGQMHSIRQKTGQAWVTVDFMEVLPEQGIAQFELMTGRKAPKGCMRAEVDRLCSLRDF